MILYEVQEKILEYIENNKIENLRDYQVVISKKYREYLTEGEFDALNLFVIDLIHRPIFVSPWVDRDLFIVNNQVRPIKNLFILDILNKEE